MRDTLQFSPLEYLSSQLEKRFEGLRLSFDCPDYASMTDLDAYGVHWDSSSLGRKCTQMVRLDYPKAWGGIGSRHRQVDDPFGLASLRFDFVLRTDFGNTQSVGY